MLFDREDTGNVGGVSKSKRLFATTAVSHVAMVMSAVMVAAIELTNQSLGLVVGRCCR